jgi:D-alanine-D-alanine ligase-like ATP-grasp enzyme
MVAAVRALGLDSAALDYATTADGGVLLFEANPHPYFPPMHERMLVTERRTPERLVSYYETVGDFFAELVAS